MAFVTYILLSTLLAGLRGQFHPELLGLTATTAIAVVFFEIMGLKLACYLLAITNESQLLDLIAYSGYKFVGIIATTVVGEIGNRGAGTGGWAGWTVFIYTWMALAFFLVSLRSDQLNKLVCLVFINCLTSPAPFNEIRDHSRELTKCRGAVKITEESADTVLVHLFFCCPTHVHVDIESSGLRDKSFEMRVQIGVPQLRIVWRIQH